MSEKPVNTGRSENDVDHRIEELMALRGRLTMGRWSENIAEALALVEQLGIRFSLDYWPDSHSYIASPDDYRLSQEANLSAEAVAAAILAWLEAQEAER